MSDALRFRELVIRRMRGFPGGGIRLSGLSPGVNLVHGPNASGKTTTAEALQALLWPAAAPEGTGLGGRLELGGDDWTVEVDGRRVSWQREGRESSAPSIPPADTRDRYFLSLHGLLKDDDRELADRIRVESAGGYDVAAAAKALEFGAGGRRRSLLDPLAEAEEALADARRSEEELRGERSRLLELQERLGEAAARAAELEPLKRALALARAREEAGEADRAVSAFPPVLQQLTGQELDWVRDWEQSVEDARRAIAEATDLEGEAAAALAAAGLGEEAVPSPVITEVEHLLEGARSAESDLRHQRAAFSEAGAVRARAGEALGIDVDGAGGAPPLSGADLDRLDALIGEAESVRQERAALEERLELLGEVEVKPDPSLARAADHLRQWLRVPEATTRRTRVSWVGVAALLVLAMLALLLGDLVLKAAGLVGLVAAATVAVLTLRDQAASPQDRAALQQQVRRLDHAPDSWTVDAVEDRLDELERRIADERLREERRTEVERLERHGSRLEEREAELSGEKAAVAASVGLDHPPNDLTLHVLAGRVRAWQEARDQEAEAEAAMRVAEDERDTHLRAAADRLAPFFPGAELEGQPTLEQVHGRLADLRDRREQQAAALARLETARAQARKAERDLEERAGRRAELFERLGLEPSHTDVLERWVEQLPEYRDACRELDVATRREREALEALRTLEGDTERANVPVAELQSAVEAAEAAAAEERELDPEVAAIGARLEQAFGKHDVEEALARVDGARAALADQRERDVEDEVGAALAEWVRGRTSDHDRPAVFHRARELFGTITRGRYLLDMPDEADEATFRARDTTTHRGHALDELSSGTRLQLLLAVRLAFVEEQESGAALPLLLDEVLANCDDHRAGAIIDAAIAIAADGRQVFYFTAQADELSRWRMALESRSDVEWCERSLGPVAERDAPAVDWQPVESSAPAPAGRSHGDYGRLLEVPPFDPWAEGVGGLHLWYLVEDVDALHQLLGMGISTWGQLDLFCRVAPDHAPGTVLDIHEAAARAARLCDHFRKLWRQGRGRPVDRTTLEASGAVSDVFMDRVSALCEELQGDADELVTALGRGDVAGFRSAKTEELRDHFLRHGHITEDAPLDETRIRLTLLAAAARDTEAESAGEWLDRLLGRLTTGAEVDQGEVEGEVEEEVQ